MVMEEVTPRVANPNTPASKDKMADCIECSICCEDIGCARATLACSHTFHLGCIGRWILKNESCPLCRKAMEEKERIHEDAEEDEEDEEDWVDDEEEDEDDEEDEEDDNASLVWRRVGPGHWLITKNPLKIPEFNEEDHALWVMRKTFEMAEDGASIEAAGSEPPVPAVDTLPHFILRSEGVAMGRWESHGSSRRRASF